MNDGPAVGREYRKRDPRATVADRGGRRWRGIFVTVMEKRDGGPLPNGAG